MNHGSQKVLNFWGGPGSGKSTLAAGVFSKLKLMGYNVELVREYAKDLVWKDGAIIVPQDTILAEQYIRQVRLSGQVDLIITDSPVWMSTLYGSGPHAKTLFDTFDNYNVLVLRNKPYNPKGREQNEDEARMIDARIHNMQIPFDLEVGGDSYGVGITTLWASRELGFTHGKTLHK